MPHIARRFGPRAQLAGIHEDEALTYVMYEQFVLTFAWTDHPGRGIGVSQALPGGTSGFTFLGRHVMIDDDPTSIAAGLDLVDSFCRLNLSGRALRFYDALE